MRESIPRFWLDRTPRERSMITIGVVALTLAFTYAYLWLPIVRERARLIADMPQLRTQVHQMRADALLVERLRSDKKTSPQDASTAVANFPLAKQGGSVSPEIITEANGRIRAVFTTVRADDWLNWVSTIALKRISIDSVRIDALDDTGMIKASATFSSGDQ